MLREGGRSQLHQAVKHGTARRGVVGGRPPSVQQRARQRLGDLPVPLRAVRDQHGRGALAEARRRFDVGQRLGERPDGRGPLGGGVHDRHPRGLGLHEPRSADAEAGREPPRSLRADLPAPPLLQRPNRADAHPRRPGEFVLGEAGGPAFIT